MKTFTKILVVLLIAAGIIMIMSQNYIFAAGTDAQGAIDGITVGGEVVGTDKLSSLAGRILTFLQIASGIAAVIMIAVTGFRYIIETPEVKGELKKNMFPIIVGIVLVFFATSIAKFFIGIFNE